MLKIDLPFLEVTASPKEAFTVMKRAGRSAIVSGGAHEYRLIRAEDLVRASHSKRRVLAELPYHPAGGANPYYKGQLYFVVRKVAGGTAQGYSVAEWMGSPLMASPADCYCSRGHDAPGSSTGDKCVRCGSPVVCVRF